MLDYSEDRRSNHIQNMKTCKVQENLSFMCFRFVNWKLHNDLWWNAFKSGATSNRHGHGEWECRDHHEHKCYNPSWPALEIPYFAIALIALGSLFGILSLSLIRCSDETFVEPSSISADIQCSASYLLLHAELLAPLISHVNCDLSMKKIVCRIFGIYK